MKKYFVYILADNEKKLSIGITNYITRKIFDHKNQGVRWVVNNTTTTVSKLVYIEETINMENVLKKEKYLKWLKTKHIIALINETNPTWKDLYIER